MAPSDALLRTLAAVPPGSRVLDLACRDGHHTAPLAALGFDVWACDPDPDAVATARSQLDAVLGDGAGVRRVAQASPVALGYPDAFADWVVASGLAESEIGEALAEARRVLKPGGWLWIELPTEIANEPEALTTLATSADLVVAEAPRRDAGRGTVFATYRRVESGVVA